MLVTIQIRTEYGVTVHTDGEGQNRDIRMDASRVTVMRECMYAVDPDDEAAERIYRAARHFNEAIGGDLAVLVTIDNTN